MNEERPYEYRAWQHNETYERIEGHMYHNQANRYFDYANDDFKVIDPVGVDWAEYHWVDTWV